MNKITEQKLIKRLRKSTNEAHLSGSKQQAILQQVLQDKSIRPAAASNLTKLTIMRANLMKIMSVLLVIIVIIGASVLIQNMNSDGLPSVSINVADNDTTDKYTYTPGSSGTDGEDTSTPQSQRASERSASFALESDDPQSTYNSVKKIAEELDGYIISSNYSAGEKVDGHVKMRIPAAKFDQALSQLRGIQDVKLVNESIRTIDKQNELSQWEKTIADLDKKIKDLETKIGAEKNLKNKAILESELKQSRTRKTTVEGYIKNINLRTDYATVDVDVASRDKRITFSTNLRDLRYSLEYITVFWLQIGAFIGIPLAVIWIVYRTWKRKSA